MLVVIPTDPHRNVIRGQIPVWHYSGRVILDPLEEDVILDPLLGSSRQVSDLDGQSRECELDAGELLDDMESLTVLGLHDSGAVAVLIDAGDVIDVDEGRDSSFSSPLGEQDEYRCLVGHCCSFLCQRSDGI